MSKDELIHFLEVGFILVAFIMGYLLGKISG
jgi:hypothetical protein